MEQVLGGYNGTIMAYGQTSSGKTYTMEGHSLSTSHSGIIPRLIHQLFHHVLLNQSATLFTITVSFLEIYNEKVQDLLNTKKTNLQLK